MTRTTRPLHGRKLLVAGLGVGSLTFAVCAAFPGCNLLPPPPCPDGTRDYYCGTDAGADAGSDAGTDGRTDGGSSDGAVPRG